VSEPRPLDGFPVAIALPVAWGEMDAFGHVNNAVYFRYFESARMAYFEKIGYGEHMERTGVGPILARTGCAFRAPLGYPDTVEVGARVSELGEDRFTMAYRVVSRKLDKVAAEGDGRVVNLDYRRRRKAPLPEPVRAAIEQLEGRSFPRVV